jgi:hypothetical protein
MNLTESYRRIPHRTVNTSNRPFWFWTNYCGARQTTGTTTEMDDADEEARTATWKQEQTKEGLTESPITSGASGNCWKLRNAGRSDKIANMLVRRKSNGTRNRSERGTVQTGQ